MTQNESCSVEGDFRRKEKGCSPDKLVVRWNAFKCAYSFLFGEAKRWYSCIYYVILAVALSQQFCRAQQWISVSSSQIEILTGNDEREARAALQVFENARQFFSAANLFPAVRNGPVRIFAFQSREEYAPYRLNSNAFGHFLHSGGGDYIALEDIKPEHYEAALHEYTHYLIRQADFNLPTWLNEGLADLYSSLESEGTKTVVGRLLAGRMTAWENRPTVNLRVLFAVTPASPYYRERDKLTVFYAQSWALTHMLVLDEEYAARFPGFLKTVSSGMSSTNAFLQVYGKTLEQVEEDLKQYRTRLADNKATFNIPFGASTPSLQVRRLPDEEKRLALAELLAAHPATASTALQTLSELAQQNSIDPSWDEKLGEAAWNMNRLDEARSYWGRAFEHSSRNAEIIYRYALMQKQAGVPEEELIRIFERVLELTPDFDDARLHLGLLQFNRKQFSAALESLSKLKTIKKDWAYAYYSVRAYCDLQFGNIEEAIIFEEKARLSASTVNEQLQVSRLLAYVQARVSVASREATLASAKHQQIRGEAAQAF